MRKRELISNLFQKYSQIRYIAIYTKDELISEQRENILNSSALESDKYEELLVNPTLLSLARQRGNIDCGGLIYLLVCYGNFYQFLKEIPNGHISICISQVEEVMGIVKEINQELEEIK